MPSYTWLFQKKLIMGQSRSFAKKGVPKRELGNQDSPPNPHKRLEKAGPKARLLQPNLRDWGWGDWGRIVSGPSALSPLPQN